MNLHPSLTLSVIEAAVRRRMSSLDNPGFCIECGHEHDGIEPDAREYPCEVCEADAVYGADELLMEVAHA